jgi:tRNA threonylcarbamoyladenosine modification (KEOPS) complex  Pcc1 subunit
MTTSKKKLAPVDLCSLREGHNAAILYKYDLEVDYPRPEWAQYVANSLAVDKELKPQKITKTITVVNGKTLKVKFVCVDLKLLRTAVTSFYEFLILATNTLIEFG